ncbi:hypothetical protein AcW1_002497 [Taiwanofungus camphoratus]|nr:hypothetical protein AcW1_002497 [Antrodia cinnamomea]
MCTPPVCRSHEAAVTSAANTALLRPMILQRYRLHRTSFERMHARFFFTCSRCFLLCGPVDAQDALRKAGLASRFVWNACAISDLLQYCNVMRFCLAALPNLVTSTSADAGCANVQLGPDVWTVEPEAYLTFTHWIPQGNLIHGAKAKRFN